MAQVLNQKIAPQLRFSSFNEQWKLQSLEQVCKKKISYGIVQAGPHIDGGMPYIKSMDLNSPLDTSRLECTSQEIAQKYRRSEVEPNDIVFSLRGNIGISQVVPSSITVANLTQGTARISPIGNVVFFQQQLQTQRIKKIISAVCKGSTFKEISLKELRKVPVTVTSEAEQKKIANFLSSVDTKIQQLRRKHTLMQQYKKGVMQQLFSQQVRFKDDDGRDYPDWEEKRLENIAEIIGGGTPKTTKHAYWKGDVSWLTPTELKSKYIFESKRKITPLGLSKSSARMLPKNTVLFSSRATVGDVSIAKVECSTNQGFQSFVVNDLNNYEYLYYWIVMNKSLFLRRASGSTFLEISKKEIKKIKILLPYEEEQKKIANVLKVIDEKTEQLNTQITQAETFKKGLLQQMFV